MNDKYAELRALAKVTQPSVIGASLAELLAEHDRLTTPLTESLTEEEMKAATRRVKASLGPLFQGYDKEFWLLVDREIQKASGRLEVLAAARKLTDEEIMSIAYEYGCNQHQPVARIFDSNYIASVRAILTKVGVV